MPYKILEFENFDQVDDIPLQQEFSLYSVVALVADRLL